MEKEVEKEKALKKLIELIRLNPDIPVICEVSSDVIGLDEYAYYLAKIGSVELEEIYVGDDHLFTYDDEDYYDEDYYDAVNDYYKTDTAEIMSEEDLQAAYNKIPWIKVIVIYVDEYGNAEKLGE